MSRSRISADYHFIIRHIADSSSLALNVITEVHLLLLLIGAGETAGHSNMQAMERTTAARSEIYSEGFVALRHSTREVNVNDVVMPGADCAYAVPAGTNGDGAISGVAEGEGLAHDAGNLLGALGLYSELLAMPGVLHEEHREYADELRKLSDRSWAMIERLVNHARTARTSKATSATSVLPDVVEQCKGLLSRIAGRTVEISLGVGAFQPVRVPVESVERILTNLVKNAAEAGRGTISIHIDGVTRDANRKGGAEAERGDDGTGSGLRNGCGFRAAADADRWNFAVEWAWAGFLRSAGVGGDLRRLPEDE